jgi:hypothetical protein
VIQGADAGNERPLKPWIGPEAVDLFSLLEGTERRPEPAVEPSTESERPARTSGVYRADKPFAASNIVPSQLAVDSVLIDLVTDWRARDAALGMLTPAADLGDPTGMWEAGARAQIAGQSVQHHTGLQPAPEIQTDAQTGPRWGSRRGASSSPAQPTDLLLKAGLYGIGASVLTAKTLSAGRMDGKRRLFGFRRETSR